MEIVVKVESCSSPESRGFMLESVACSHWQYASASTPGTDRPRGGMFRLQVGHGVGFQHA